jgi:hypothetical protein
MRRALCHSHIDSNDGKQRTISAQNARVCTILMHPVGVPASSPLLRGPEWWLVPARRHKLKPEISLATMQATAALALVLLGMGVAYSQAPIRERGEAVSGIDGARRAADVARNGLVAADARHADATTRLKNAEDGLLAAQKEVESARTEKAAADRAQQAARTADERARAALARALDARK